MNLVLLAQLGCGRRSVWIVETRQNGRISFCGAPDRAADIVTVTETGQKTPCRR